MAEIDRQLALAVRRWQAAIDEVSALRQRRRALLAAQHTALIAAAMAEDGWPLPDDEPSA